MHRLATTTVRRLPSQTDQNGGCKSRKVRLPCGSRSFVKQNVIANWDRMDFEPGYIHIMRLRDRDGLADRTKIRNSSGESQ
ncbi:MAG: hypothetical protein C5B49_08105 [Bdellovibrio sp.]|nr:MAG: hypothetical protein C5B49_08105 [Bdellovibrio sp.]